MGAEVAIGGWNQTPSGTMGYKSFSDSIDLENEAKYDSATQVMARAKIDMPLFIPNIYLMATPMKFDGTGQKTQNFDFGDKNFNASAGFYSELVLNHYDVALYYGIPFLETLTADILSVELGIDARIMDVSATVRQDTFNKEASFSETILVPMVYLGFRVRPMEWLAFEGEGRGIAYNSNHYYDAIARVKFSPLPTPLRSLFIAGGWRYENIALDEKDIIIDVTISGPFLEAGVDF
ncbi:MAG: hypothetical protein A2511_16890 [Deltaproteobacteria bacterium RIFOXYD12_FULL_50_9]|nr:MAG: hypothetical protein A2511_16890 [Deltaproteobacteria bacterium RIFOXYD12_FULL_50_9]